VPLPPKYFPNMRHGQSNSFGTFPVSFPTRISSLFVSITILLFIVFSSLQQIGLVSRIVLVAIEDRNGSLKGSSVQLSLGADDDEFFSVPVPTKADGIGYASLKSMRSPTVYHLPNDALYQAQSMVEESIGPAVLNNSARNPLQNCSVTVQFRLIVPQSGSMTWLLQSMTVPTGYHHTHISSAESPELVPKTFGGDEIYVEWRSAIDPAMDVGIALVTDRNDGTYTLEFVRPPILQYNHSDSKNISNDDLGCLTIYYDYSCGIGGILAPDKDDFTRAGEIHASFVHDSIPRPYINDFVPPNQDLSIDLSKYHTVIAFGDSLMMQLAREYAKRRYWHPSLFYADNVNQCLSDPDTDVQSFLEKFNRWHRDQLVEAANRSESVAVIAGSAVWDALRGCLRNGYVDHVTSIRLFVEQIREMYPLAVLYWKSPSAVALHRRSSLRDLLNDTVKLQRSRYTSNVVPSDLYKLQKGLMAELNVPFLDLYEAYYLSIPWTMAGSAVHYDDSIASLLLSYYWPGLSLGEAFQRDD
jgi:hypothetical protein